MSIINLRRVKIRLTFIIDTFISVVNCGAIIEPSNAKILSWQPANGSMTYNSSVSFQCNSGLWFSREVYVRDSECDSTGKWTSVGQCVGKS